MTSRLTSADTTFYFAGGTIGSAVSATLYAGYGWAGVCMAGAAFSAATLVLWAAGLATDSRARARDERT